MSDTSDNEHDHEFHDAEDTENELLEERFSDALDLNEPPEPELTEEEFQANKEKAESLKLKGNEWFKNAEYENSIEAYT